MHPNTVTRLAMTGAIAAVLLLCAYTSGSRTHCVSAPLPAIAPAHAPTVPPTDLRTADVEDKARQAARDYVKETYPGSKSDGVFLLPFCTDNLYLAGVDTTFPSGSGASRHTLDLLVRQYVRKNGTIYWRADGLSPEEASALRQKAVSP